MMHYMEVPHKKKKKEKNADKDREEKTKQKITDLPVRAGTEGRNKETKREK